VVTAGERRVPFVVARLWHAFPRSLVDGLGDLGDVQTAGDLERLALAQACSDHLDHPLPAQDDQGGVVAAPR
jgi:hypothetical protein